MEVELRTRHPVGARRPAFDLAVRVGLEAEGSLRARKLIDNEVCLVATPELIARAGELQHPDELARYPTVAYAAPKHDIRSWRYREQQEVRSVEVEPLLYVSDGNALLDAVKAGVGVGYVSAFAVQPELESGELVRVLPAFELPAYAPVYMLYAASDYTSPKLEALQRALLEHAKQRRSC